MRRTLGHDADAQPAAHRVAHFDASCRAVAVSGLSASGSAPANVCSPPNVVEWRTARGAGRSVRIGIVGSASAHDGPLNPFVQTQAPPLQMPLPWQPLAQASELQSYPEAPGWQKQTPATQVPRRGPPQSEGHSGCSQVGGAKPGLQTHSPLVQIPLPLQPFGHARS